VRVTCTCTKFLKKLEHPHPLERGNLNHRLFVLNIIPNFIWEYTPFQCKTLDTKYEKAYLFELFHFCKWLRAASNKRWGEKAKAWVRG